MQNGYLWFFSLTYLDKEAENFESLFCAEVMRRRIAGEIVTVYQNEMIAVDKAGIRIQELSFAYNEIVYDVMH